MTAKWKLAQWLEIRWWKRYLSKKDIASYLNWKRSYWLSFLEKIGKDFEPHPGARVLDAGCGPAGLFMVLEHQTLTAIDPLLDQYAENIPHFDPDAYPWVDFKAQQLEHALPSDCFDFVYCLNVINHVQHPEEVVRNINQSLKKGGMFVLSVDTHRYKWLRNVFRFIPLDALHPHQATKHDYLELCRQHGFDLQNQLRLSEGFIFNYDVFVFKKID